MSDICSAVSQDGKFIVLVPVQFLPELLDSLIRIVLAELSDSVEHI